MDDKSGYFYLTTNTIAKKDLIQLIEEIDPADLEAAYWAVKRIADHQDQAWYWTESWQQAEREVDAWKESGQPIKSMDAKEALAILDRIIE